MKMIQGNCSQSLQKEMTNSINPHDFVNHCFTIFIHVFHLVALIDYAVFRFQYEHNRLR
jgi:hypothetical protein